MIKIRIIPLQSSGGGHLSTSKKLDPICPLRQKPRFRRARDLGFLLEGFPRSPSQRKMPRACPGYLEQYLPVVAGHGQVAERSEVP